VFSIKFALLVISWKWKLTEIGWLWQFWGYLSCKRSYETIKWFFELPINLVRIHTWFLLQFRCFPSNFLFGSSLENENSPRSVDYGSWRGLKGSKGVKRGQKGSKWGQRGSKWGQKKKKKKKKKNSSDSKSCPVFFDAKNFSWKKSLLDFFFSGGLGRLSRLCAGCLLRPCLSIFSTNKRNGEVVWIDNVVYDCPRVKNQCGYVRSPMESSRCDIWVPMA